MLTAVGRRSFARLLELLAEGETTISEVLEYLEDRRVRRTAQQTSMAADTVSMEDDDRLIAGGIVIDPSAWRVQGRDMHLSPTEYRCLYEPVLKQGRVIPHAVLVRRVMESGDRHQLKVSGG